MNFQVAYNARVSLILILLGLGIALVGMVTPGWYRISYTFVDDYSYSLGLFYYSYCKGDSCEYRNLDFDHIMDQDSLRSATRTAIVSLAFCSVASVLFVITCALQLLGKVSFYLVAVQHRLIVRI